MTPGDSARLRHPLRDFEERLATVVETTPGRVEDLAWDIHGELGDVVTIALASMHDVTSCCLDVNLDNDSYLSPKAGARR